ncbi:hypothetical protein Asi02nite_47710 [Asanoa siamensis]|uniref:Uncharacterized protein n=1 Tax=Asanoa siamensis TaxID=926357 RepID=A0ABQ4CVD4_9ACTN|nr:hypothetical protein Asi02nite_47710 [Asanoa siamensis]
MRLRQQRVQRDHLVPVADEQIRDLGPDEPGRAGDQYPHSVQRREGGRRGRRDRATCKDFTRRTPGKGSVMPQFRSERPDRA